MTRGVLRTFVGSSKACGPRCKPVDRALKAVAVETKVVECPQSEVVLPPGAEVVVEGLSALIRRRELSI